MNDIVEISHDIKLQRSVINRIGQTEGFNTYYVMYPISRRLEYEIDIAIKKGDDINIELENGVPIKLSDIKAYGELSLFSSDDYDKIKALMNKQNYYEPYRIPKDFDYDSNTSKTTMKGIMHKETFSFEDAFEYYHAIIGKPERILIVKMNARFFKQSSRFKPAI